MYVLFCLVLPFLFQTVTSQDLGISPPLPTNASSVSLAPEISATAVSSLYLVLATSTSEGPDNEPAAGDAGSWGSAGADTDAGAAGPENGPIVLSRIGLIAIIVAAVCVCVFGAVSALLFYFAKKKDWKVRENIRKSARRVATALTPRRTTFPRDIQNKRSALGLTKFVGFPKFSRPTMDVEKGNSKISLVEISAPPKKSKWLGNVRK